MKFVDYVTITVKSGHGGSGSVAFRREKYVPKGGPAGGDGGDGGSVILEANKQLYTLLDLRYNRHHFAKNGDPGSGSNKKGKDGPDIVLEVPVGTLAKDADSGEQIGELVKPGERLVLASGGRGGLGNSHFKSSTNQTPRYAQPGEDGEERNIVLELKLLADVGLVGLPNAGKSTLISALSAARPKVADYPFTTLRPSLGVVYVRDYQSFVMADIPGIIEGAHEGKGLGIQFLKHIERNAVLVYVIPTTTENVREEYDLIRHELAAYDANLGNKLHIVALSKLDLMPDEDRAARREEVVAQLPSDIAVFPLSAVARIGLEPFTSELWELILYDRELDAE